MRAKRSYGLTALLAALMCAVAILGAACEKDNDIVAQEQLSEARQTSCEKGCEEPKPECQIKGNISDQGNKFYHLPGGRFYDGIKITPDTGERWFCTEREAVANGWRKSAE